MVKKRDLDTEELKIYAELQAQHKENIKTAKARLKELEKDPEYDGSIYVAHYCDGMGDDDGTLHTLNKMLAKDGFTPGGPFDVKHKSKARFEIVLMRDDGIDPLAVVAKEEKVERARMARHKENLFAMKEQHQWLEERKAQEKRQNKLEDSMAASNKAEEKELTAEEIVASDLSWEDKKKRYAKVYAETKANEKEQELKKDDDELEL